MKKEPLLEPSRSIGIWVRVSPGDQARGDSPRHHEIRARHYAAAKGWTVHAIYDLTGVSGKTVFEHPEAKRMMEDVRKGNITGLIFSKLARLTRNARELMDFSDFFQQHNADLISLQENIDTGTPSGRLFYNIVAAMAQWEREEIADRIKASQIIRSKLGKPLNGKSPFGYHWKDKKLQPHPDEAPVRKLMYELFLEHKRKKTVARLLNERGYRTREGKLFTGTTVGRLIQDTTAKGKHRLNFTRAPGRGKPWALKPEHEWVWHEVEPVVSVELWDQCNELLVLGKTKQVRLTKKVVHLFAGLTSCECGTKMYVPSHSPKYVCTNCRNKIPIVDLEAAFLDELKGYLQSPEHVAEYLRKADITTSERKRLVEALEKEMQKVQTESDRLYQLYMEEGITAPQFKERNAPLDTRKQQLLEELPRAQAELDILKSEHLTSEYIMAEAQTLHSNWPKMSIEERRNIVEIYVKNIIIGKGEISLSLYYLPSSKEITNGQRCTRDALPFCQIEIKAKRTSKTAGSKYTEVSPMEAKTIGEHIRNRRLELNLLEQEAALQLGIYLRSLRKWERGAGRMVKHLPAIIRFLGYVPPNVNPLKRTE